MLVSYVPAFAVLGAMFILSLALIRPYFFLILSSLCALSAVLILWIVVLGVSIANVHTALGFELLILSVPIISLLSFFVHFSMCLEWDPDYMSFKRILKRRWQ